jgi:hypothetical protein
VEAGNERGRPSTAGRQQGLMLRLDPPNPIRPRRLDSDASRTPPVAARGDSSPARRGAGQAGRRRQIASVAPGISRVPASFGAWIGERCEGRQSSSEAGRPPRARNLGSNRYFPALSRGGCFEDASGRVPAFAERLPAGFAGGRLRFGCPPGPRRPFVRAPPRRSSPPCGGFQAEKRQD